MKNKILAPILFILFTLPLAGAGGGFVGSMLFVRWQKLNSKPSVLLLYEYAQHMDKMPAKLLMPFKVSVTISLLISILPALIILAAVFAKPKRELHGSSRFANAVEVQQAGLLKPKYDP
ncbi:TPA: type IV secretory system conjugative DNA transfer family protein, partial [Neisseria gonorrhoeae]